MRRKLKTEWHESATKEDKLIFELAKKELGPFHWIDIYDYLEKKTLELLKKKKWAEGEQKPATLALLERKIAENDIAGFFFLRGYYEAQLSRWERLSLEQRIKEMLPDAERGRKVLEAAWRGGENKKAAVQELRRIIKNEYQCLLKKRLFGLSKSAAARIIHSRLTALAVREDQQTLIDLIEDAGLPCPNTIRRII